MSWNDSPTSSFPLSHCLQSLLETYDLANPLSESHKKLLFALSAQKGIGNKSLLEVAHFLTENTSTKVALNEQIDLLKSQSGFRPQIVKGLGKLNSSYCEQIHQQFLDWRGEHSFKSLIWLGDPDYPFLLSQIPDPPLYLFVEGDLGVIHKPAVALVGSRHPSPSALELAQDFAYQLALKNWTVVSGLAQGIDGQSHWGAIAAAQQSTIAVMGTGMNITYPTRHKHLRQQIIESGGLIVSEFPLNASPHKSNFPKRNRIVSGLCRGVLVIEAALKSGSLVTARLALEQNREVFAVPGTVRNPYAEGCNYLIQQGAKLVSKVEDIFEEFQFSSMENIERINRPEIDESSKKEQGKSGNHASHPLLEFIDYSPVDVDTIIRRSGWSSQQVLADLMQLELQAEVELTALGYQLTGK